MIKSVMLLSVVWKKCAADEPYRLHPLGKIEDLDGMHAAQLYEQYKEWLQTSPIDIYVVGNTTLQ